MSKAKEISAMWSEIRPQLGKMINLCHQIESHAELHDNVTADAFQKGYDAAWEDIQPKIDAAYQKGLEDVWECTKKIYLPIEYGGIPADALRQMFDNKSIKGIFMKVSAREAVEKVQQYIQAQEEKQHTWIFSEVNEPSVDTTLICSECGYTMKLRAGDTPALNFCPKCGDNKNPGREKNEDPA